MPNDANGNPVAVGDAVLIPGTVTSVTADFYYVNCTVELQFPLPPTGARIFQSLNTQQLQLVTPPTVPPVEPPVEPPGIATPFESGYWSGQTTY